MVRKFFVAYCAHSSAFVDGSIRSHFKSKFPIYGTKQLVLIQSYHVYVRFVVAGAPVRVKLVR